MHESHDRTASVLLLHDGRAALASAPSLGDELCAARCTGVAELPEQFRGEAHHCLITTLRDPEGRAVDTVVRQMLRRAPRLAVAVIVGALEADDAALAALVGLPSVRVLDADDPALRQRLVALARESAPAQRLGRYADRIADQFADVAHSTVGALAARLVRESGTPRSVRALADEASLPERSLRRLWRQRFGSSLRTWIGEARLLHALVWLESTGLSAEQVALRGGWSGLSALQHASARRHGMPLRRTALRLGSAGHFAQMLARMVRSTSVVGS